MNRRHLKLLAVLLPLFIARSLLPIGFMLSFDGGTPQMVFCPSVMSPTQQQTVGDAHHAHHQHAQQGHEHDSGGADASHQTCPFAFAGAAPLMAAIVVAAEPQLSTPDIAPADLALPTLTFRANPIRGPPSLS